MSHIYCPGSNVGILNEVETLSGEGRIAAYIDHIYDCTMHV